jgi:hypothetical protein
MIRAVDLNAFWDIIGTARKATGSDSPFHQALTDQLAAVTADRILEYQERFEELHRGLDRWDLRAAAYLIGGSYSDDSFMDFRAGLIAQGHDWYKRAVTSADNLASHPSVKGSGKDLFYEEVTYAALNAYERVTGDADAFYSALDSRAPANDSVVDRGEEFDISDKQQLLLRLPKLAAHYSGGQA